MKTTINEIDGKLVATFEGELDTAAAIEVEKEMNRVDSASCSAFSRKPSRTATQSPSRALTTTSRACLR